MVIYVKVTLHSHCLKEGKTGDLSLNWTRLFIPPIGNLLCDYFPPFVMFKFRLVCIWPSHFLFLSALVFSPSIRWNMWIYLLHRDYFESNEFCVWKHVKEKIEQRKIYFRSIFILQCLLGKLKNLYSSFLTDECAFIL